MRPGAIHALVDFMNTHDGVGIAGSRLEDPDGTPQRSAFRFPTIASEFERGIRLGVRVEDAASRVVAPPVPEEESPTDWVAGASMIVRRAVFDAIGLMDEKYFMYFEEVDFCLQAKRAGWPCWYVPASRVVHLVGAASELSDARKHRKRRPRYWFDSRRRYFVKNHGLMYAALADLAFVVGFALWRCGDSCSASRTAIRRSCWAIRFATASFCGECIRHDRSRRFQLRPFKTSRVSASLRRSERTGSRTAATGPGRAFARSRRIASATGG